MSKNQISIKEKLSKYIYKELIKLKFWVIK